VRLFLCIELTSRLLGTMLMGAWILDLKSLKCSYSRPLTASPRDLIELKHATIHKKCTTNMQHLKSSCYVRKQTQKGYRCDVDQGYICKYVYKVYPTFGLDAGPAAREEASLGTCDATTDESEDDDGAGCLPTNAWIATNSQKVSISHPLEDRVLFRPWKP